MRIAIMQPYFFPYIGYFAIIAQSDYWVVLDSSQYTRRSWMNRNRIMKNSSDWGYISIPVQNLGREMNICDAKLIDINQDWKELKKKILFYKKSFFYKPVSEIIQKTFENVINSKSDKLVDLNVEGIKQVCSYLNLSFKFTYSSQLNIDYSIIKHSGQWALKISQNLGASQYINPINGKSLFIEDEFKQASIQLSFLEVPDYKYTPKYHAYHSSLSIIDILMWNSPEDIVHFLKKNPKIL